MRYPIKILRIQSRIVIGGVARQTICLSRRLTDERFDTILVGGAIQPNERSLTESARDSGVDCRVISNMGQAIRLLKDAQSVLELYRLIKREQPTIVHTHTAKAGAVGRVAAFLARVPYVFHTFHGHVFYGYFGRFRTWLYIVLERLLARLSTAIIVISEKQKADIVERFRITDGRSVRLIPLGLDWDELRREKDPIPLRQRFHIPRDRYLIGIVGRIVPVKDHHLFVEIAERLVQSNRRSFHFMVIGDGELRPEIESEVRRRNLEAHFTFTGWVEMDSSCYENLDLVLITSKNEGTPVSAIEALAARVPVIARDVGGVRDLLGKVGEDGIIQGRNPQVYADIIEDRVRNGCTVSEEVAKRIATYYSVNDHRKT